jgi:amino acid transporter
VIGKRQIGQAVVNAAGDIRTFYAARIPEPYTARQRVLGGDGTQPVRVLLFFVFLAIVNSTIGNADAGVNIVSRMSYAMGRIHAFPSALARVHPRHRSPVLAIVISSSPLPRARSASVSPTTR